MANALNNKRPKISNNELKTRIKNWACNSENARNWPNLDKSTTQHISSLPLFFTLKASSSMDNDHIPHAGEILFLFNCYVFFLFLIFLVYQLNFHGNFNFYSVKIELHNLFLLRSRSHFAICCNTHFEDKIE